MNVDQYQSSPWGDRMTRKAALPREGTREASLAWTTPIDRHTEALLRAIQHVIIGASTLERDKSKEANMCWGAASCRADKSAVRNETLGDGAEDLDAGFQKNGTR